MSFKYHRSIYHVKNAEKYTGNRPPICRSSWELSFCIMCDNNPAIQEWVSEPLKIPYRDPLTGKQTVYVPDFLISYVDKDMKRHVEIIEIKPEKHTLRDKVSKNPYDQAQYVKNLAKWQAANEFCRARNIKFRVINENNIYHTGSK